MVWALDAVWGLDVVWALDAVWGLDVVWGSGQGVGSGRGVAALLPAPGSETRYERQKGVEALPGLGPENGRTFSRYQGPGG